MLVAVLFVALISSVVSAPRPLLLSIVGIVGLILGFMIALAIYGAAIFLRREYD